MPGCGAIRRYKRGEGGRGGEEEKRRGGEEEKVESRRLPSWEGLGVG